MPLNQFSPIFVALNYLFALSCIDSMKVRHHASREVITYVFRNLRLRSTKKVKRQQWNCNNLDAIFCVITVRLTGENHLSVSIHLTSFRKVKFSLWIWWSIASLTLFSSNVIKILCALILFLHLELKTVKLGK